MSTAAAPEGEKILIVDDDPGLLKLLGMRLISEGYQVSTAESGQEGLRLLAKEKIDLEVLFQFLLEHKDKITNKEYQEVNGIGKSVTIDELRNLVDKEILVRIGETGRGTYYELPIKNDR